ncbi:MAG: hypothetical protein SW833_04825 [Cyanobacteriota bacterium]|nr:hypothetical protein [Cyanobacteriota bacterium]
MSVVSGKVIFCEGKESSLDFRLLNKIFENSSENELTIVPAGSKFNFSTFARGYFSEKNAGSPKFLVFRDRDFDAEPPESVRLIEQVNKQGKLLAYMTHRTCVENYLLDAELIHQYWGVKYEEKEENPNSKWGHGNSPGIEAIAQWIETSARKLREYQAVRWALGDLVRLSAARKQLTTTWTGSSGNLPSSLTLPDCKTEAKSLISQFSQAVAEVTQEKFEESLGKYRDKFKRKEFWEKKEYFIWFQGKDLQKMMQNQNNSYISLKNYFDWAIPKVDIEKHDDLKELLAKIEEL